MATDFVEKIAGLLHEVGEVHHVVYSDTEGNDDDWASFYADWLLTHGKLGDLLGKRPVRSHLTRDLVNLDESYTAQKIAEPWPQWYAVSLIEKYSLSP